MILMKKRLMFVLWAMMIGAPFVWGADHGEFLARLDSRDFSAEKDVLTGVGGVYVGETSNPHAETVMFQARDEFYAMMNASRGSEEKTNELCAIVFDGLKSDISTETKVWLLTQIACFGVGKDVAGIVPFLTCDEPRLVDAAALALAKIPGDEAAEALEKNQTIAAVKSAIRSRYEPILPQQATETSMPNALCAAPDEEVETWLSGYASLDDEMKARTLAALTQRDDKKYRDYAIKALDSDSEILRRTGFLALEKMGTAEDVDRILARLDSERDLTIRLCSWVVADGFDDALCARLSEATDLKRFLDLATILVLRAVDVKPEIFAKTTATVCDDRLALMQLAAQIATKNDVPNLVATALRFERGKDRDAAENIIAQVCLGDASAIIALLDKFPADALYPMICRTGGDAAKEELARGLDSKDPALQTAAMKALPTWADAKFAEKMMTLLTSGALNDAQSVPILRAYIRVMSLPDDKIGITISRDGKLENLKMAFALAKRVDERRLILSRLAANRTEKSLEFAVECASDPELADAAFEAIADHAHDTALRRQFPEQMTKAIDLVIEKSGNKELVDRVKIYKGRME